MLEKTFHTIPTRPAVYPFGVRVVAKMRGSSETPDFGTDGFMLPSANLFGPGVGRTYDVHLTTGRTKVLPPIEHSADNADQPQPEVNTYHLWKLENPRLGMKNALFPIEPGMEKQPKTTTGIMFPPRERTQVTIHTRLRPKPRPVATQIVPIETGDSGDRLLPSVDREKMAELPCDLGKSKKLLDPPTKASGVFYTDGDVVNSQSDPKYWTSLSALWGKEFSRKRDLPPTRPTAMTVHYFNGGAPGSPLRPNRRTCMQHKRGDSSRVDFAQSLYGKDKDDNYL